MNYQDWVQSELKGLSTSLGFYYTPEEEVAGRLTRLRSSMKGKGIEALLVVQKMDYYYLSGSTQNGILFVPIEGKPLLMVKREVERLPTPSNPWIRVGCSSGK